MGDEADDEADPWIFSLSAVDSKKYTEVKRKFDSHFVKMKNLIFESSISAYRKRGEPVMYL